MTPSRKSGVARPKDLAVLVVMALVPREHLMADEVRGQLKRLGFDQTAQQVGSWLARMSREEMPCVEGRTQWGGPPEYTLTRYGWTLLGNTFEAMRAVERIKG